VAPSPELALFAERELDRLCAAFPLGYRPALEWRPFRTTAGMAYYRRRAIGLGAAVLTTPERLRDTLVHEYAHLLAFARHGARGVGHGPAWRRAMHDLGAEPRVRHAYEAVRNVPRQRVLYRCLRCGAAIERRRRLPKGRTYVHARCGGGLRLEEVGRLEEEGAAARNGPP
jgi:SprT protein